jgi:hypothetical protein
MRSDERGSAAPLLAVLVVAVGGLCFALGRMGGQVDDRARAQTAADAAALAGAADGEGAARALARANGARVLSIEVDGHEVQVTVRVGEAEAVARATR